MGSKVAKLVKSIRAKLNDPEGDRWSTPRLIDILAEGSRDLNGKVRVLRDREFYTLQGGISLYKLPWVHIITRVTSQGLVIPLKSMAEMDRLDPNWESVVGDTIQAIVFDKLNPGQIRVYPTPTSSVGDVSPAYGVVTDLKGFSFSSPYGVITDCEEPKSDLVVYFIRKLKDLTNQEDLLELDSIWDKALCHYVCGVALRDDRDTQNRAAGSEELQLYGIELQQAASDGATDFTQAGQYQSSYRSF